MGHGAVYDYFGRHIRFSLLVVAFLFSYSVHMSGCAQACLESGYASSSEVLAVIRRVMDNQNQYHNHTSVSASCRVAYIGTGGVGPAIISQESGRPRSTDCC